jgi:hypothetical protein
VFERVSVARDYEVLAEALRQGRGHAHHEKLKGLLTLQESSGAILRSGNEIATAASLQREREMIECINRGIGARERNGWKQPVRSLRSSNPGAEAGGRVRAQLKRQSREHKWRRGNRKNRDTSRTLAWTR